MNKHVLVVGGTQGIGRATAVLCAQAGATVVFTGRNNELGKQLESTNPQRLRFASFDVLDFKQIHSFTQLYQTKIDMLVLCAGGLNYGERRQTHQGLEQTFAQNVASRFYLMKKLTPLLQPHAKVINVLGGGVGGSIDMADLQLEKNYSFMKAASQYASITDALTMEFGKRYGHLATFFHVSPGVVNTRSVVNQHFPWFISYPALVVLPWIASSPESVARVFLSLLDSNQGKETFKEGYGILGPKSFYSSFKGDQVSASKFVLDHPECPRELFEYLEKVTEKAAATEA